MKGEEKGTGLEALAGVGAPRGWGENARYAPVLTSENLENSGTMVPPVVLWDHDRQANLGTMVPVREMRA